MKKLKLSTYKEEYTTAYAESGPATSSSALVESPMAIVKPTMIEVTGKSMFFLYDIYPVFFYSYYTANSVSSTVFSVLKSCKIHTLIGHFCPAS